MDRALQRYLIAALLIFISTLSYAQSSDLYLSEDSTGNKVVIMTPKKFGYYFQLERNLKAIEDSIPKLAKNIERERRIADSINMSLKEQVTLSEKKAMLLSESKNDCIDTAVQLELENLYLDKALYVQRKKKWYTLGIGVAGGILLTKIL